MTVTWQQIVKLVWQNLSKIWGKKRWCFWNFFRVLEYCQRLRGAESFVWEIKMFIEVGCGCSLLFWEWKDGKRSCYIAALVELLCIKMNSRNPIFSFSSVQSVSHVQLFVTPWTAALQASLSITTPRACSNSYPLSWWCHPAISSPVSPSPPSFNLFQGLFQWVSSSH